QSGRRRPEKATCQTPAGQARQAHRPDAPRPTASAQEGKRMNKPLPLEVTRDNADAGAAEVARRGAPDAAELARRLARETSGEVLFDPASRGRYATDASIYQIMPTGVFVPRNAQDVATAIDIARDLGVPITSRGGGTSQCGQTIGPGLIIDNTKHLRK